MRTYCRLGIEVSVDILSRHVEYPRREHMVAVKRLFRLLQEIKGLGLALGGNIDLYGDTML